MWVSEVGSPGLDLSSYVSPFLSDSPVSTGDSHVCCQPSELTALSRRCLIDKTGLAATVSVPWWVAVKPRTLDCA